MSLKQKIIVSVCAVICVALIATGAVLFFKQRDIVWVQACESGLKARQLCQFAEAEKALLIACQNAEKFELSDERRYSSNLALAEMYVAVGDFSKAYEFLEKARISAEIQSNVQNQLTVMGLRADALSREAKFEDCRMVYNQMSELARKTQQISFEIDALFGLSKLDILFLKRQEAEALIDQIDTLSTKLGEKTEYGILLSIYSALISEQKGRYKTTELLYDDASHIVEHREQPSSSLKLLLGSSRANFYCQARNYVRAKKLAMRVLENSDKNFESYLAGHSLQALRTLAWVYLEERDALNARRFVDRELEQVGKRLSIEHPFYGLGLVQRAVLESREGKKEESERDFKAAQKIFVKAFGEKSRFTADTLTELARLEVERSEFESASQHCKQALAMYKEILPNDHPSSLKAMMLLSLIYKSQGKALMAQTLELEASRGLGASEGK